MSSIKLLAYEQAHLIGKGGGAATASRRRKLARRMGRASDENYKTQKNSIHTTAI